MRIVQQQPERDLKVVSPDSNGMSMEYRDGMACLGTGVTIVTTDGPAGRAGFAATAVCSVSDNPPTLLVCLNKGSSAHPAIAANGVLCVNVAAMEHQQLCALFGGKTPVEQRFSAASWMLLATGAPVLEKALASFDCKITSIFDGGTHDVLVCRVVKMARGRDGRPLIYFNRAYHSF